MLLTYLMVSEDKQKFETESADLKNMMFGHALMSENPDLYFKVYPPEDEIRVLDEGEEAELEWIVPQTQEDLQDMMGDLAEVMGGFG